MRAVNLLPPDLRSGPKGSAPAVSSGVENSGAGAFVVLGVLAFSVCALAAYVLAGNTVKDREAELAAATAKSAAVTQQVAALKPYADFESVANARVQTVTDLANSRFDWEQALRDLSRAVPADVTIASLKGDLGRRGRQRGGSRSAARSPRRRSRSTGCTYSQTKVAELMARLRNIDGVTRVSLSKSDKEATTAGRHRGDRNAPSATGYCGKAGVPVLRARRLLRGRRRREHGADARRRRRGDDRRRRDRRARRGRDPGSGRRAPAATPAPGAAPRPPRRRPPRLRPPPPRPPPRAATVTKNRTLLIAVVATAAAIAAFWFLALAPKREEAAKLEGQDRRQEDRGRRPRRRRSASYQQGQGQLRQELRDRGPARQGRAGGRRRPLAARAAGRRGRRHERRLPHGPGRRHRRAAPAPRRPTPRPRPPRRPPAPSAVGTAGFSAMPFTFSFKGTFGNLSQFFARMERFVTLRNEKMNVTGRLLRLESDRPPGRPGRLPQHPRADRRQLLPGARDAGPHRGRDPAGPGGHDARGDPGPAGGPAVPTTTATVPGATR